LIVLLRFLKHTVVDREQIKLIAHETTKRIFGRTHDRLATYIEAGVDQNCASGQLFETFEQPVEQWISVGVHSLNARRVVDVRYRRNFRTRNIELVDAEKRLLLGASV
jgi:hypothetical protein